MKKILKGIAIALAFALVITPCAILFAGCGDSEANYIGVWNIARYKDYQESLPEDAQWEDFTEESHTDYAAFLVLEENGIGYYFEFAVYNDAVKDYCEENDYTFAQLAEAEEIPPFTWELKGDTLTITISQEDIQESVDFKIIDGKLQFDMNDLSDGWECIKEFEKVA